jgi:hypothetical protein
MASNNPADWTLDLFYPNPAPPSGEPTPPYTVTSPVKFPPAIALDDQNRLVLVYGTGDIDDTARMDGAYVVSVTEHIEWDASSSKYLGKAYLNWALCPTTNGSSACLEMGSIPNPPDQTMLPGEKLTGVPIVFDKVAYFSTFVPLPDPADPCKAGDGRIWGLLYNYKDLNAGDDVAAISHLVDDNSTTTCTAAAPCLYKAYPETYVAGLALVQRPSCFDVSSGAPPAPGLGSASREAFEVVAQVSQPQDVLPSHRQVQTATIRIPTPPIVNYADSWGSVFE